MFLEFIFPGFWDGELLGDRSEKSVNSTATSDVFRIGIFCSWFPWQILVVPEVPWCRWMPSEVIESVEPVRGWCDGSGVWSEVEENVSRGSRFGIA